MPIFALTCPECDAVLKMANAMPAGKKVKCPKCEAVFPVPAEEEETPPAKVKHRPAPVEDAADAPLPDEDDDERRPRRRRKKDKSKEEKRGPSGLVIGLAIAGIVLLVLGAATGGGIYWYLTSGNNSGTGNEDPLAYLPADASMLVGMDPPTLMAQPGIGAQIEQGIARQSGSDFVANTKKQTGIDFKDLFGQVVMAGTGTLGNLANSKPKVMVIKSKVAFTQRKIRNSAKNAAARKANGKTYYKVDDADFTYLYMPSDRIIVLSNLDEEQMKALVGSDGSKSALAGDMGEIARQTAATHFWLVVPIEEDFRKEMQKALGIEVFMLPPEVQPLIRAIPQAKAVGVSAQVEGGQVKVSAQLACKDAAVAQEVTKGLQGLKNVNLTGFVPPEQQKEVKAVLQTLQASCQGTIAQVSLQFPAQALAAIQLPGMHGGAGGPPGGMPPGGMRPGPGGRPGGR